MNNKGITMMKRIGRISAVAVLAGILSFGLMSRNENYIQAATNTTDEVVTIAKVNLYTINTKTTVDQTWNKSMDEAYSKISPLNTFWGVEGDYHISYSDDSYVYIDILSKDMKLSKTLEIKKEMKLVGNVTQDKDGNYYIVYGQYDTETKEANSKEVMCFVKYDKYGRILKSLSLRGKELTSSNGGTESGTKEPFNFASCELFVDNADILVCYYGRVMYNGHQSSHAVYIDTNTFERKSYTIPYVSHSFNQKAIQGNNGEYIFVDRGDAYDRGVNVTRISKDSNKRHKFAPFHFRNGYIYQHTYATLAGISELSNGYALVGTSENILTYTKAKDYDFDQPRNVFMQVFSKNFTSNDTNSPSVQLLDGVTRKPTGTFVDNSAFMLEGIADYGVKWLTDYTGNTYASVPKMISLNNDEILVMWEKKEYIDGSNPKYRNDYLDDYYLSWTEDMEELFGDNDDQFLESYYMIVDKNGNTVVPHISLGNARISEFDNISLKGDSIYWTTSSGKDNNVTIYQMKLKETVTTKAKVKVTGLSTKEKTVTMKRNETSQIKIEVSPSNATNKNVIYGYDNYYLSIDKEGKINATEVGTSTVTVVSKDNPLLFTTVKITVTDSAPTGLKAKQYYDDWDYGIKLTWNLVEGCDEYEIYRSTSKNKGYNIIGYAYENEYYDNVSSNKTYYYKVRVYRWEEIDNPYSNNATGVFISDPDQVSIDKKSKTSATLSWARNKYADGYEVYYYNASEKKYVLEKTIKKNTTISFTKSKLATGKYHYFKVRSYKMVDNKKYYSALSDKIWIRM